MSKFTFLDSVQFDERRKVTTLNVTPDDLLAASTAEESIDGDRPLVLVVDDSPSQRMLARAVAEQLGYPVLEAADG